jgi:hypothetical protein
MGKIDELSVTLLRSSGYKGLAISVHQWLKFWVNLRGLCDLGVKLHQGF